jgi:hypothetical protein
VLFPNRTKTIDSVSSEGFHFSNTIRAWNRFRPKAAGGEDVMQKLRIAREHAKTYDGVVERIDLYEERLAALGTFMGLSREEFIACMPGYKRLMPLLSLSVMDISRALLLRHTDYSPKSAVDLMGACER